LRCCAGAGGDGGNSFSLGLGFLGFAIGLLPGLANINAALEESAIFNGDALGDHVAGQRAFAADLYPVAGVQVTAHLADDHDLTRADRSEEHTSELQSPCNL